MHTPLSPRTQLLPLLRTPQVEKHIKVLPAGAGCVPAVAGRSVQHQHHKALQLRQVAAARVRDGMGGAWERGRAGKLLPFCRARRALLCEEGHATYCLLTLAQLQRAHLGGGRCLRTATTISGR